MHSAAQLCHDVAPAIPCDDFGTNAVGTLNVLEAVGDGVVNLPLSTCQATKSMGISGINLN